MTKDTTPSTSEMSADGKTPTGEMSDTSNASEMPATEPQTPDLANLSKQLEEMKAALKKANNEATVNRHKANELDSLKTKAEQDKLTETERLQKQLTDLQSERDKTSQLLKERTVSYEVKLQAATMGIVDPDAAAKLLDWSEIEYDNAGNPTNVDALLKALMKAKPYLAATNNNKQAVGSGGATNPARSVSQTTPITMEFVSKITADQYERLTIEQRKEVQRLLRTR